MTNCCTSGSTGESAVCDEGDFFIQTHSGNCRSRRQHFSHTRTTGRTFITDNNHIASNNFSGIDSSNRFFFAVEYLCRSFMHEHFRSDCTSLDNTSIRSKIATQNSNTTCFAERIVNRSDNFRVTVDTAFQIFAECLSGYSHDICMNQTFFIQFVQDGIHTSGFVELFHIGMTCRS